MRFPTFLYQPERTATLVPIFVNRRHSLSSAAASLNIQTNQVPLQYVLALASLTFRAVPGAAQTFSAAQLDVHDLATAAAVGMLWYRRPVRALAAAEPWGFDDQNVATWLMPGHLLSLAADFSAGAAANEAVLSYTGWLIPRGNVQFGGF
jgi:hypothetical protein